MWFDVIGLSTYLPLRKEPPLVSEANLKTPIFMAHGDADYTVRGSQPATAVEGLALLGTDALDHSGHGCYLQCTEASQEQPLVINSVATQCTNAEQIRAGC